MGYTQILGNLFIFYSYHVLISFPITCLQKHVRENIFYPNPACSQQVWHRMHLNSRWFVYISLIPCTNDIPNSYLPKFYTGKCFLSKSSMLPAGLTWDVARFQLICLYFTHTIPTPLSIAIFQNFTQENIFYSKLACSSHIWCSSQVIFLQVVPILFILFTKVFSSWYLKRNCPG